MKNPINAEEDAKRFRSEVSAILNQYLPDIPEQRKKVIEAEIALIHIRHENRLLANIKQMFK